MKISIYIKNILSFFIFYFLTILTAFGQVGINTTDADQSTILTVKSGNESIPIVKVTDNDGKNLFQINNNGYVGLGKDILPQLKLDLRGSESGAIGIGTTDLSASSIGEGGIRYSNEKSVLEYSDGSSWVSVQERLTKAYVLAVARPKDFVLIVKNDSPINGWTVMSDVLNNFNPSTGIFTVPRAGVYYVSCFLTIQTTSTNVNGTCELNLFYTLNGVQRGVKNVFPIVVATTNINIPVYNTCFLYLNQGDTIYVSFYQGNVNNPTIYADDSLNTFIISEM